MRMRIRILATTAIISFAVAAPTFALGDPPVDPPADYRWEIIEAFSDEFDGTELDASKWHAHIPNWAGRPPGKFMPSSVSVQDGFLQIQCTPLDSPQGEFKIACGAIQSKSQTRYGYYECRMKASKLSTSTNFWMVGDHVKTPIGTLGFELIIQFAIGNSKDFSEHMKSNAMISLKKPVVDAVREKAKATGRAELTSSVSDEFHTYGCWWVDANTMKFYADGRHVYTINPSTKFTDKPFEHPLRMTLVCETFDWQPLPTKEELTDPTRNTAFFDYLRSYRLVKTN